MKLAELLKQMREAMDNDLSDDFLKSTNNDVRSIGQFRYGISMVPCDWVYPYLYALASDERFSEIVKDIENDTDAYYGDSEVQV